MGLKEFLRNKKHVFKQTVMRNILHKHRIALEQVILFSVFHKILRFRKSFPPAAREFSSQRRYGRFMSVGSEGFNLDVHGILMQEKILPNKA